MVAGLHQPQLPAGNALDFLVLLFGPQVSLQRKVPGAKLIDLVPGRCYFLASVVAVHGALPREKYEVRRQQAGYHAQHAPRSGSLEIQFALP